MNSTTYLQGCPISETSCGALLFSCFPKLCDGCDGATLELVKCEMGEVALGSCVEMLSLESLVFSEWDENGLTSELLEQVDHATSLQHLEIRAMYIDPPLELDVMKL